MDFESRKLIDSKYIGNTFLEKAFNKPVNESNIDCVTDSNFNPIGNLNKQINCVGCNSKLARPIGCYGCFNFTALLEADHQAVLKQAELKLKINEAEFDTPLNGRFIEKLREQIEWIKYTIHVCKQNSTKERTIDDK